MGNVHLKVLVWVGVPCIAVQCEEFPLARKMPPSPGHHPRVMIKASPPSVI